MLTCLRPENRSGRGTRLAGLGSVSFASRNYMPRG